MLTVYRVGVPIVYYRSFQTDDSEFNDEIAPKMLSESVADSWRSPEVFIHKPKLKKGDFLGFLGGYTFALKADLFSKHDGLNSFFEQSGEVLPLKYNDEEYVVFNCTNCLEALDRKKSQFFSGGTLLKKYAFLQSRFHFTLFTIPENRELLCVEGMDDPEDEFKGYVEENKLTGLIFEKLWSEDEK